MKKKLLFIVILFLYSITLFASFEISIDIPMTLNFNEVLIEGKTDKTMKPYGTDYNIDYTSVKPSYSYDFNALLAFGNRFNIKNEKDGVKSISLLTDLGYSIKSYAVEYYTIEYKPPVGMPTFKIEDKIYEESLFHALNVGLLTKINMAFSNKRPLSIGIGGGIRVPLQYNSILYYNDSMKKKSEKKYSYSEINEILKYPLMPYVKFILEGYFYLNNIFALKVGGYASYNFGTEFNVDKINRDYNDKLEVLRQAELELTKYKLSSFDIGITLGLHIGKKHES